MAYSSSLEAQAQQHTRRVTDLAGQYLSSHSEAVAEALEGLYSKTMEYYQQRCDGYAGVLATHAHMLALWNVNEHFRPGDAYVYARVAQDCYKEFLDDARNNTVQAQESIKVHLRNVWLICAYIEYNNENMHGALDWMRNVQEGAGVADLALTATIFFRLTMDEGMDGFMNAFNMFKMMDQAFTEPLPQPFEEDILRTAYGFYELYYTHSVCDEQESVPYNPALAVGILTRAYGLFHDPQQKEWMQANIDSAAKYMN